MIGEHRTSLADAVTAALGFDATPNPPETVAAPAAWLEFVGARYDGVTGWELTFDVTLVADVAQVPGDVATVLDDMLDAVLQLTAPGVSSQRMTARGAQTVRVGDVPHPAAIVTVPIVDTTC